MQTNLHKHFKTSKDLETNGVEFKIDDVTSFTLRRFNSSNPRTKAAMAVYFKPYARQVELGTLPEEMSQEITIRLFIDICLAAWKGVTDENGKELAFTKENAFALFKDLPDLFETLWKHVNSIDPYREELGN